MLVQWAGGDAHLSKLLRGKHGKDKTKYALIGFGYLAGQLCPTSVENLTPEHYVTQAVQDAGFNTKGSEDLLGKREATKSGEAITDGDRTFDFPLTGIADGANYATLMDLHRVLSERYGQAGEKEKRRDATTYHVALHQILNVHTYDPVEGIDPVDHPALYTHNAYFLMLVKDESMPRFFPGHSVKLDAVDDDGQDAVDDEQEGEE